MVKQKEDLVLIVILSVSETSYQKSRGKLKKFEKKFEKKSGRIWSRCNKSTLTGKYGS